MSIVPGFEVSYQRHFQAAARRAILRTLAHELDPDDVTVGDVVDAARSLGVAAQLGDVTLDELARELHRRTTTSDDVESTTPPATEHHAAARTRPRGARPQASDLGDERMDLERAVEVFVPVVSDLGQASMADLEDRTGVPRRKLRFHVGQLVKAGHLQRHGMGRGTYYTVA